MYRNINRLETIYAKISRLAYRFFFNVKSTDIEFLAEFLKEIEFNYPIIIDEGNEFLKNNTRPIEENVSAKIIWLINARQPHLKA